MFLIHHSHKSVWLLVCILKLEVKILCPIGHNVRTCHLDRVSNVEIGVECQIFIIVISFNYS